jgi:hypothetical protein
MAAPVFACFTQLVGKYWRTSAHGKKTPWALVFDEIKGPIEQEKRRISPGVQLALMKRPAACTTAADVLRRIVDAAGYTPKYFKHGMEDVIKWLKKKTWGILFEKNLFLLFRLIF